MSAERTDAALIERSLREPREFAGIFDRHFDAVYGYAARRLGAGLGEEIAAETFARAFDRRSSYDPSRADSRPWLFGIAANLMRRHWRSERRRLHAYTRIDAGAPPDTRERADLVAALEALPAKEREALFFYALADLTYDEIATALDVPIGTVRSRLARARDRMRAQLDDALPEGVL